MKPIDWLLAHLDEPGVSEILLAVGRPAAVREEDTWRRITSMTKPDGAHASRIVAPRRLLVRSPPSTIISWRASSDRTTGQIVRSEDMPDDLDPKEFMRRALHDCPECRAALEAGEQPRIVGPDELFGAAPGRTRFARRPRWRKVKRRP